MPDRKNSTSAEEFNHEKRDQRLEKGKAPYKIWGSFSISCSKAETFIRRFAEEEKRHRQEGKEAPDGTKARSGY